MNRNDAPQIEQAMLEVLTRPCAHVPEREDVQRREGELRALFVKLPPAEAHALVRRYDAGADQLALALRQFLRRRR